MKYLSQEFFRVLGRSLYYVPFVAMFSWLAQAGITSGRPFSRSIIHPSLAYAPEIASYTPAIKLSEKKIIAIFEKRLQDVPAKEVASVARHFRRLCKKHQFDPAFVLSLIQVESRFRAHIISPAGAVGLMQLMPGTGHWIAHKRGVKAPKGGPALVHYLKNPYNNLTLGMAYLSMLRDKYEGLSPYFLLAAYNVGPARMDELIARGNFKATQTRKYFEDIVRGIAQFSEAKRS